MLNVGDFHAKFIRNMYPLNLNLNQESK